MSKWECLPCEFNYQLAQNPISAHRSSPQNMKHLIEKIKSAFRVHLGAELSRVIRCHSSVGTQLAVLLTGLLVIPKIDAL